MSELGPEIRLVHGSVSGLAGNFGIDTWLHYGAVLPNFGTILERLVKLEFGQSAEITLAPTWWRGGGERQGRALTTNAKCVIGIRFPRRTIEASDEHGGHESLNFAKRTQFDPFGSGRNEIILAGQSR